MAEGGFEEFEMGELGESFPEYDDMSNEELNTKLLDLRNNLVDYDGDKADLIKRIEYIEKKMLPSVEETSFLEGRGGVKISTGGEGEVNVATALPTKPPTAEGYTTAVDKFIQDTHGIRVRWDSEEGLRLRSRLDFAKNGDIVLKRYTLGGQKGKRGVVVLKRGRDGTFRLNDHDGVNTRAAVQDFTDAIKKMVEQTKDYEKTAKGMNLVDTRQVYIRRRGLTDEENREHAGVLDPGPTIDRRTRPLFLREQVKYLDREIIETKRQLREKSDSLDSLELHEREISLQEIKGETLAQRELEERVGSLESLRDEYEEQATKEEVRLEQEEDIGRLERFKRWAKENMVGLSVVAISVAGIITTVIVAGRKAIMRGAQATSKFAKALANLAKKLGPLLAPLLNMLATVISWGAKSLAWLASNLWVLVVAVVFFLYQEWGKKKRKRKV